MPNMGLSPNMNKQAGFTLFETTIVVVISLIILGVSIPFYTYFQAFSTTESARQEVVEIIRQAQIQALGGLSNNNHGVYFSTSDFTLYQGPDYANRDQAQDQILSLQDGIEFSNLAEINFTIKSGTPSTTGTLNITNTNSDHTEFIVINELGLIQ